MLLHYDLLNRVPEPLVFHDVFQVVTDLEAGNVVLPLPSEFLGLELLADDVVVRIKEVFADVAKEMKMADKVRHVGKNNGDGLEDSLAHVMNKRQRSTVGILDLFQKRVALVGSSS